MGGDGVVVSGVSLSLVSFFFSYCVQCRSAVHSDSTLGVYNVFAPSLLCEFKEACARHVIQSARALS